MSTLSTALPMTRGIPASFDTSPTLSRQWLQESWLVGTRWALIPLTLSAIHFIPEAGWLPPVLLSLALLLMNAAAGYCLGNDVDAQRVHCAQWVATTAEWATALTIIGLSARDPRSMAPALLLPALVLTTVRFGVRGLLGSVATASLVLTVLVTVQVHALQVLGWSEGAPLLVGTVLLIVWTALPIAGSAHAAKLWRRWELDRWERDDANLRRLQCGLSAREWEILPLLLDDKLTYDAIGRQLCISPDTVKTHVKHLGSKLGVSGRRMVIVKALDSGLLPPQTRAQDERLTAKTDNK